jgi:hypothetical protein
MPHWMFKALLQKSISLLPMSDAVNNFFQDHVTRTTNRLGTEAFETKLRQGRRHLEEYLAAAGTAAPPASVLELGTGWFPIIPTVLFLAGVPRIFTMDRSDMLRQDRLIATLQRFLEYHRSGRLAEMLPHARPERMALLEEIADLCSPEARPADILARLGIDYRTGDARRLPLPDHSVDFVFSNWVIGFIPEPVLAGMFTEFRRVARPGAIMSHFVDCADLYAFFDRRITPYNFLRYSRRTWSLLNNGVQYLNRLRVSDYRRLHRHAGFEILREDNAPGSLEQLATVPLAAEFRAYAPEDLAVLNTWIISRSAGRPA